jgi:hypothetical protein
MPLMDQARFLRLAVPCSTTSRNASLIRLCQPRPFVLKCATRSLSSRIVVCTLVGFFCDPRPFRGLGRSRYEKTSCAGFAFRNVSRVHRGLSLSTLLMIKSSFFRFRSSQADDTNSIATNGEGYRMETAADHADRKSSILVIVETLIRNDKGSRPVEVFDRPEGNAVLAYIGRRFGGIPFVLHIILLLQIIFQERLFVHVFRGGA